MRAFLMWLAVSVAAWVGADRWFAAGFRADPQLVVVVLDTSFAMEGDWAAALRALDRLDNQPYAKFALYGPRGVIHGPADKLDAAGLRPYGARDFDGLSAIAGESDRNILVTNAGASDLTGVAGWEIVRP